MSILKFYNFVNEAVGNKKLYIKIKEDTYNYLAYFIDEGYQVSCNNELRWIVVYIEHKSVNRPCKCNSLNFLSFIILIIFIYYILNL